MSLVMKIYVSGKISGLPLEQAKEKFKWHVEFLREKGHEVVSPFEINEIKPEKTWGDYMENDIKHLVECDAIYMISDWRKSTGARIEYMIAKKLKLEILYHGETNEIE